MDGPMRNQNTMKKMEEKRLVLRKITVANLTAETLAGVMGGMQPVVRYTQHSICADQCCASDPNANCPRTF
jgi:hypothetical protein